MHIIVAAYRNYKGHFDRKAITQPVKVRDFVFLLNQKYDDQNLKQHLTSFHWLVPYKVTKVLSNSNYINPQIGTLSTHCVHRMRLRLFLAHTEVNDIQVNQKELCHDREATEDTDLFDGKLPPLPDNETDNELEEKKQTRSTPETIHRRFPTSLSQCSSPAAQQSEVTPPW